jgi:hypothetical protein
MSEFVMVRRDQLERWAFDMRYVSPINKELRAVLAQEAGKVEAVAWLNVATGNVTTSAVVVMDWDDENEQVQSLYTSPPAPVSVMPGEPMPITEGMDRLMEAYRLGEFRLEGGSPTVEAMSCKSFDENADAVRDHDFDSYAAGYQAAMYEEGSSLLWHIACLDKLKELNQ